MSIDDKVERKEKGKFVLDTVIGSGVAVGGAAIGATIGSAFGPIGTAVGTFVGDILGHIFGFGIPWYFHHKDEYKGRTGQLIKDLIGINIRNIPAYLAHLVVEVPLAYYLSSMYTGLSRPLIGAGSTIAAEGVYTLGSYMMNLGTLGYEKKPNNKSYAPSTAPA